MRDLLKVTIGDLTHNDVDGVLDSHLLRDPLSRTVLLLQRNDIVSEIFTKADMNDVARQNIAELRGHVYLMRAILVNFSCPVCENFEQDGFQSL